VTLTRAYTPSCAASPSTTPFDRRNRNVQTAPVTEPAPIVTPPADLIPISHLALDLPEPPLGGWVAYLSGRDIEGCD
jgi:hypothetical protein